MKPFWQSKSFWTAVIIVAVAGWNEIAVAQFNLPKIPEWVFAILGGFGVYTRSIATGPLTFGRTK